MFPSQLAQDMPVTGIVAVSSLAIFRFNSHIPRHANSKSVSGYFPIRREKGNGPETTFTAPHQCSGLTDGANPHPPEMVSFEFHSQGH
jgi:hypothetical protein